MGGFPLGVDGWRRFGGGAGGQGQVGDARGRKHERLSARGQDNNDGGALSGGSQPTACAMGLRRRAARGGAEVAAYDFETARLDLLVIGNALRLRGARIQ